MPICWALIARWSAIIRRLDDVEDKLVVAPEGVCFTREQILALTAFQEQYFKVSVEVLE